MWLIGFTLKIPNELFDEGDFEIQTDVEYALLFVQRLSKLEKAAEKLDLLVITIDISKNTM